METNFEHYKYDIILGLMDQTTFGDKKLCDFICEKVLKINRCIANNPSCEECKEKFKEWLAAKYEKEPEPEIDWAKVPTNTLVLVKNCENEETDKIFQHFAHYEAGAVAPFCCFANGQTSWTSSEGLYNWEYCELANKEDKIKYKKD